MKQQIAQLASSLVFAMAAGAGIPTFPGDAAIVERSEIIVVGHLKPGTIKYFDGPAQPYGPQSWEHRGTLVITEIIKGVSDTNEMAVIIHSGLIPKGAGITNSGIAQAPNTTSNVVDNKVQIIAGMGFPGNPVVEDATRANIWFLHRLRGTQGSTPWMGNLGIMDREDVQPLKLKEYFSCYLSTDPGSSVKKYASDNPQVAARARRFLDAVEVREISKLEDTELRFDGLLPYFAANGSSSQEARAGIVSCGRIAGRKFASIFDSPKYQHLHSDIILIWGEVGYKEAVPVLSNLLKERDRFWAEQKLGTNWWNSAVDSELTQKRRGVYVEVINSVVALGQFSDSSSREAVELTKKRWEAFSFENRQMIEACDQALSRIAKP